MLLLSSILTPCGANKPTEYLAFYSVKKPSTINAKSSGSVKPEISSNFSSAVICSLFLVSRLTFHVSRFAQERVFTTETKIEPTKYLLVSFFFTYKVNPK